MANAFDDFMRAFESFKAENEQRIATLEKRLPVDVLTTDKLDRINRAIDEHKSVVDELVLKSARPQLGSGGVYRSGAALQHKAAFETYVRHGETNGLHLLEEKALSVGSGPDGGYLVPAETEAAVIRGVKNISPIRAIAGNRTVSASVYKKPFAITGPATGWVAETATRPETNSPTLAELAFPTMELYAMPSATQTLLDERRVRGFAFHPLTRFAACAAQHPLPEGERGSKSLAGPASGSSPGAGGRDAPLPRARPPLLLR
jgi:HK97 family phage major capsid protein